MKKRVDVYPTVPVLGLRVPIYNTVLNHELSVGDIATCIYTRALVDEILTDGSKVRLSLANYDKDNSKQVEVEEVKTVIPDDQKPDYGQQSNDDGKKEDEQGENNTGKTDETNESGEGKTEAGEGNEPGEGKTELGAGEEIINNENLPDTEQPTTKVNENVNNRKDERRKNK